MSGFMDVSKYTNKTENKSTNKTPSFMDVSKYKFMDTSKYTKKEEQPKEKSFINKVGDFLLGTPKPLQAAINADNKGASLVKGFTDSATLGLTEDATSRELAKKHAINYNAGKMLGYVTPGGLISKGVEKVAAKTIGSAAKEVGKRVATSAVTGGGLTAAENAVAQTKRVINKEPLKPTSDIMKEIGVNTAAGGLLDLGLMGLGKVGSKIGKSAFKSTVVETPINSMKLKGGLGKLQSLKSRNADIKANDYYNNIDAQDYINSSDPNYIKAENKFRSSKGLKPLTPEEIVRGKPQKKLPTQNTNIKPMTFDEFKSRITDVGSEFDEPYYKVDGEKYFTGFAEGKVGTKKAAYDDYVYMFNRNNKKITPSTKTLKEVAATSALKQPPKVTIPQPRRGLKVVASTETPVKADPKIVTGSKADKVSLGNKLNNLYTATIDRNKSIADFSKLANDKTYTLATNSANQKNIADYILKDNLVDRKGNVIGDSFAKVIKDIPKGQENDFMMYALQKHNIARAAEGKPVLPNYDSLQSSQIVKNLELQHPEWKTKSENITGWINKFMNEWGVKSGVLNKDIYDSNLKTYPNYIPTNRDFSTIEQTGEGFGGGNKGFVNQTTPIKRATGSNRDIIDPRENIANMVVRTIKTAKNNEVGQSLVNSIRSNPDKLSKYAEIVPEPDGNVGNVVRVLENGHPTYVKINDLGLLKAMENLNKTDIGTIEAKAKTLTNAFKALITQKNPIFGIRNAMRDTPTAYINGSENNPIKFGYNLLKSGKDIVTNSKDYQQYKALGGGGSNFFDSSNPTKSIKELTGNTNILVKGLKAIPNIVEKGNNVVESAPRFSEFRTVLKKTGDLDKAMYAANDITTNFSKGGDVIKHIDSFTPYANAAIQGLSKEVSQLKKNPIGTIAKGVASITVPSLVVDHMNKNNPNYQNLDQRTKDNYYLFPNPTDGGKTFIKIPKARELGVLFGSLAERTQRALQGDNNAYKEFGNTVATNFAPSNPIENNILAPLIYNIPKNKDFANRSIVPQSMIQDGRSPKYQYDEKTSELAKKLGEIANLSPKQIDYVIKSYTGVLGQMGLPALTKTPGNSSLQNALKPITSQFVADPLYSNSSITDFYNNLDKLKQKAADRNIVEKIPSKALTPEEILRNRFVKASTIMSKLNKQVTSTNDPQKIKDLRNQIINLANKTNELVK